MKKATNRLVVLGVTGCLAAVALAGCSAPAEEATPEPEPEATTEAFGIAIGPVDAGTDTILVTNDTGQAITAVATRTVDAAVAPDAVAEATSFEALPFSSEMWEPGQLAALSVDDPEKEVAAGEAEEKAEAQAATNANGSVSAASNASSANGTADVVLAESVDLQVTLADGSVYVLHQIDPKALSQADGVALHVDADASVAYLTYVEDGAEVSTLAAELQAAEAEKALADAAIEAQAAVEAVTD